VSDLRERLMDAAKFAPVSLVPPGAWVGHIPFAAWLIKMFLPQIVVELGTHSGNSYFSFCQAVTEEGLATKCYAVDTWLGEEHSGFYGEEVFHQVNSHNQEHYAGFSRLLRMTFEEAVKYFSDGSIDLLHIDGLHTYEAVRHDFQTWLPKLSPGAIVLFHDTNVRERGFGVWKLWKELQGIYPNNFEFVHSEGLGVLQLAGGMEKRKLEWLRSSSPMRKQLKEYFSALGLMQRDRFELYQLRDHVHSLNQALRERNGKIAALNNAMSQPDGHITSLNQVVSERDLQIADLNQVVSERDLQIADLNQVVSERDFQIADLKQTVSDFGRNLAQRTQENENLLVEIRALRDSTSWKITSPIRWCSTGIRRCASWLSALIVGACHGVYHWLPFPPYQKAIMKGILYSKIPCLFRNTISYQFWKSNQQLNTPKANSQIPLGRSKTKHTLWEVSSDAFSYPDNHETYVPLKECQEIDPVIKVIAFYLPQYHPIPENDEWWGKGFTEWKNVARAKPQFAGHYQPHLPGELGFYDLRLIDVQKRQIELARMHGIYGFCYYYYWFDGKRLLETPLNQVLENKELDFPFCICWANENWCRRWDGLEEEVLIRQKHSADDDLAFIRSLDLALRDKRYIRIKNRPLLIVYRPELLPNAKATSRRWRCYCRDVGIGEIYLALTHAFERIDPRDLEFDAAIEFPPNNSDPPMLNSEVQLLNAHYKGIIYDYRYLVERSRAYYQEGYTLFRGVTPGWDNEARKPGRGTSFVFSSPEAYSTWLDNACQHTLKDFEGEEKLVFVNAWNEWAEGCHLEPDQRYGYAYLQTTREVLSRYQTNDWTQKRILYVSHDAEYNGAQLLSLHIIRELHEHFHVGIDLILLGEGPLYQEFAKYARVHDLSHCKKNGNRQAQILSDIWNQGARKAFTSTTVAGSMVEPLKGHGYKVVSLIHELPGIICDMGLEEALRNVAEFSDTVVFPSCYVSEKVRELSPIEEHKIVIRPQGLFHKNSFKGKKADAHRQMRAEFGIPEKSKVVMGMGYGDFRKGIDLFVRIGLEVVRSAPEVFFVWFGTCDPALQLPLEKIIAENEAKKRILFPGRRLDPDLYFSGSNLFLLTSREDPFPSVVLAAMDAGLPVVAFEGAGGFCELLEAGGGMLVKHADVNQATAAVLAFLRDDHLWQITSHRAREIVEDKFRFIDYVYDLLSYAGEHYPKVSVIVPNYNYEFYLPKRLESIIDQRLRPYEILFLDDCSQDGSVKTAERILGHSGIPFQIIRNSANKGVFSQWLRGIREARGELIWIAEADDYCNNAFLATLIPAFKDPSVVLAYCQSKQIGSAGELLAENYLEYTDDIDSGKWLRAYVRNGIEEIVDTLAVKNTIPNASAVVFRKTEPSLLERAFNGFQVAGDWAAYVEILTRGKIAYFPDTCNYHRRHNKGATIASYGMGLVREILAVQRMISDRFKIDRATEEKARSFLESVCKEFNVEMKNLEGS
jgi:O-antigen biosynthesis protein